MRIAHLLLGRRIFYATTRLVLRPNNIALVEHIHKAYTQYIIKILSLSLVTMDATNVLGLSVAILTLLSIQFLVIITLAAYSLSRFTPTPDLEEPQPRPRSPPIQETLPNDVPPPTQYVFPYPISTVNDNGSSMYSQPALPPRPQNPVPHSRSSVRGPGSRHEDDSAHGRPASTRHEETRPANPRLGAYESSEESLPNHML
jgi:hypothetical protein